MPNSRLATSAFASLSAADALGCAPLEIGRSDEERRENRKRARATIPAMESGLYSDSNFLCLSSGLEGKVLAK